MLIHNKTKEQWLTLRRTGITGSDISIIMGVHPYKTEADLLKNKLYGEEQAQTPAMEWGIALEPIVADKYAKETGNRLKSFGLDTFSNGETQIPFLANIDRMIVGSSSDPLGILEIKTGSVFTKKQWGTNAEDIPEHYKHQANWYMGITGLPYCDFAVLLGGQDYFTRRLELNAELFDEQASRAKSWYLR